MDQVSKSLNTVARSAVIVLVSTALGMGFAFGGRVVMARVYEPGYYGIFSLAWVILNFASLFSLLGIQESVTRQIAYYKERGDSRGVRSIIRNALLINITVSIAISVALYAISGYMAAFLDEPALSDAIRIFALAIPFLAITLLLASVFRGLGRTMPKVLFFDLSRNGLFLLFLIPVLMMGLSFNTSMWLFSASMIITGVLFCIYAVTKYKRVDDGSLDGENIGVKPLLAFSLPVFALIVVSITISWTDTFMLGIYKPSSVVGLYNSAWPTAQLIILFLNAMAFMYVPIAAQLHSQGLTEELKRSYAVIAKWIFAATIPLLLLFMFFPEVIISTLYGAKYTGAATALRLLSLAFFVHILFGPSNVALLVIGKPMMMLWVSLACAVLNIALNALLIPMWGLMGAATASLISFTVLYVVLAVVLYKKSGLHPFNAGYLKPMLWLAVIAPTLYVALQSVEISSWMMPLFFLMFMVVYIICLILSKGIGVEDRNLVSGILRVRLTGAKSKRVA